MLEDDGSEADTPQGPMDDEARNDGNGESSQKSESSEEPRRTLRVSEKRPRYTKPPSAKQICIPKSEAARKSKATGGRQAEPMEPKGRREPPPTLQEGNAVTNDIYPNSWATHNAKLAEIGQENLSTSGPYSELHGNSSTFSSFVT